jgi:N-acetylmuramoyl-L-alanine amidase
MPQAAEMEGRAVIVICVGHARRGDTGAVAADGVTTERACNTDLAFKVAERLQDKVRRCHVVYLYPADGYPQAMKWLAGELGRLRATLAVELHFNTSHVRAATGHEWLYSNDSEAGRRLAGCLNTAMIRRFPDLLPRGCKPITRKDNGSGFVRLMPCPAVIAEPFFGSNPADWDAVAAHPDPLAAALAEGLAKAAS